MVLLCCNRVFPLHLTALLISLCRCLALPTLPSATISYVFNPCFKVKTQILVVSFMLTNDLVFYCSTKLSSFRHCLVFLFGVVSTLVHTFSDCSLPTNHGFLFLEVKK